MRLALSMSVLHTPDKTFAAPNCKWIMLRHVYADINNDVSELISPLFYYQTAPELFKNDFRIRKNLLIKRMRFNRIVEITFLPKSSLQLPKNLGTKWQKYP